MISKIVRKDNGTEHWLLQGDFLNRCPEGLHCDMVLVQPKDDIVVNLQDIWDWISAIHKPDTPILLSTQKHLDQLRHMVRTHTKEGDTVLSFTAGSMSVAVACYLEGRNSVCIEKDSDQFDKSVEWVRNCSMDDPYNNSL